MLDLGWQFYAFMVGQIVCIVGLYWGLKRDNDRQTSASQASYHKLNAALDASHAKLSSELALAMLTERGERTAGQSNVKNDLMLLISTTDAAVRDMSQRVTKLEGGQDEWTKSLRERTHELAEHMQVLALKVDRLERPVKYGATTEQT